MFRRYSFILLLLTLAFPLAAQTRVYGTVRDAESGAPLPFAGVYFDGTDIGISTDHEGHYSLETRDPEARLLTASLLGYESLSVTVPEGVLSEIDFALRPLSRELQAALVKPDNRYLRSILRKLDASLSRNDPDHAPDWSSRLYSRIEIDVSDAEDLFKIGMIERNLGHIRQYADTSTITGKPFLPVLLSENLSDVYHSEDPAFNREVMRASRISGARDDNELRQFTGGYLLRTNFYKKQLEVFSLHIPNPAAAATSQLFYDYYLVDSLQIEGRKTYVLRFHPKKLVTSPTLDGEMHIDAEDFGIRSVHARLSESSNVNWIQHIHIDVRNRRLPDGRWFYGEEKLFMSLSVLSDDHNALSLLARRQQAYGPPRFEPTSDPDVLSIDHPVIMRNVIRGDEQFWESVRPFALSPREKGIYTMVEEVQRTAFYKWGEGIFRTLNSGYIPVPSIGFEFGPWERTVVFNDTEGFRLQLGGRTRRELTEKLRVGGYVAYGFRSRTFGWKGSAELIFGRERLRKLSLLAQNDFIQLGSGSGAFSAQNIFSSLVSSARAGRQSRIRNFSAIYEHDLTTNIEGMVEWNSLRLWHNERVPFIRPDGSVQDFFSVNQLHGKLRFAWDEKLDRGPFEKTHLYTPYPIVTFGLTTGIKGISRDDIGFFRADADFLWRTPTFSLGYGRMNLRGGLIVGDVPYTMLNLHAGNQGYFADRTAFSCMDYYEFMSDRWLEGYYEHNFGGFFLDKIPGIRRLKLREVATARFAWGSYRHADDAPFLLPEGSGTLEKPYVEAGVGIANIFRLLRVDALWRLTHRREKRNFTINLGFEIEF